LLLEEVGSLKKGKAGWGGGKASCMGCGRMDGGWQILRWTGRKREQDIGEGRQTSGGDKKREEEGRLGRD
jgi:hypothetical protein